ncbi:MAG: tetratricopeptide repeat protein, partial [Syntrophomonadaceae bacterium]|nr:tetratricopeptide repeat protein [Syntrophomonadaceae bacterium]
MNTRVMVVALVLVLGVAAYGCGPQARDFVGEGNVALEQGRYEEAVAILTRAIAEDAGATAAYVARARAYNLMEEYEKAIADAEHA